jgi:hypothetical protein
MKGFLIFKHALTMVLRNWKEALRICLIPTAIALSAFFLVFGSAGVDLFTAMPIDAAIFRNGIGRVVGQLAFVSIIGVVCFSWSAVNWHRFILLAERPTHWIPDFKIGRVVAYLLATIKLAMLFVVVTAALGFAVIFVGGILAAMLGIGAIFISGTVLILANLGLASAFFRFVAVLPAAAVGEELTLLDASEAASDSSLASLVLVLITALVNIVMQILVGTTVMFSQELALAIGVMGALALALINLSVFTTFFGHYIEGREIEDPTPV